jgi:hypothetical protein
MPIVKFLPRSEENILFRATPNRKWYIYVWKIIGGMVSVIILTAIIYSLLAGKTETALNFFLNANVAHALINFLYLGLLPLIALAWVADDIASTAIGEFILTDQRIWVRGSPYFWSQVDTQLEDIGSLTWRRDAIFLRQKSTHKVQVHMFSDGKLIVDAYEQFLKKSGSN